MQLNDFFKNIRKERFREGSKREGEGRDRGKEEGRSREREGKENRKEY